MFIVIPHLTKQPSLYGVYALCMSTSIFLNYADLGFLSSCQKYAAEAFSLNKRKEEVQYIAFGGFILAIVVSFISFFFIILSYNPYLIIGNNINLVELNVAKKLFFILALFSPFTVLARISNVIFEIRIEGYIYQRMSILQSIISILSIFYFFRENNFEIIDYYIFISTTNILAIGLNFLIIKKKYNYDLFYLLSNVKFNLLIYNKTKKLAYSGLYVLIIWIIYNESDQFMIANIFGTEKVAFFAIAISITTLFRTIFGFLFSPFSARANYFIAQDNDEGLIIFFSNIVLISMPFVVVPSITFYYFTNEFIISWVGVGFKESLPSVQLMSLVYSISFLGFPIGMYLVAKEKIKDMYFISTLQAVLYWVGIYFTYKKLGIFSFALFKLITVFISDYCYVRIYMKYFGVSLIYILKNFILPILLFILLCYFQYYFFSQYLVISSKNKLSLLIVIFAMALTVIITIGIYFIINNKFRTSINNIIFANRLNE